MSCSIINNEQCKRKRNNGNGNNKRSFASGEQQRGLTKRVTLYTPGRVRSVDRVGFHRAASGPTRRNSSSRTEAPSARTHARTVKDASGISTGLETYRGKGTMKISLFFFLSFPLFFFTTFDFSSLCPSIEGYQVYRVACCGTSCDNITERRLGVLVLSRYPRYTVERTKLRGGLSPSRLSGSI